jgi:hypothetical protein
MRRTSAVVERMRGVWVGIARPYTPEIPSTGSHLMKKFYRRRMRFHSIIFNLAENQV